jgi:hypothetical protein
LSAFAISEGPMPLAFNSRTLITSIDAGRPLLEDTGRGKPCRTLLRARSAPMSWPNGGGTMKRIRPVTGGLQVDDGAQRACVFKGLPTQTILTVIIEPIAEPRRAATAPAFFPLAGGWFKCSGDLDRYPLSAYSQQFLFSRCNRLVAELINFFLRHPGLTQGFGHVVDDAKVTTSLGHHADANFRMSDRHDGFASHLMPIQCCAVMV